MKRIYKDSDLRFSLTVNHLPINLSLVKSITFKFYTLNEDNCIIKTEKDVDSNNQILLQWSELANLEEGVLFYSYKVSLKESTMDDGTIDTVTHNMTEYFIVSGNSEFPYPSKYYTKDEIDIKIGEKQNTLVSGKNIKTINNKSVLGSGDIKTNEIEIGETEPTDPNITVWIDTTEEA